MDTPDHAEEAFNQELLDNPDPGVEDEPECLDDHQGGCAGKVEYRPSLTGTGMAMPRCDAHWQARLDWQEEHLRIYPDSPNPPSWFDPEAAGEVWDDE
jgi:hypothetical protein